MRRSLFQISLVLVSLLFFNNAIIPANRQNESVEPVVSIDPPFLQADSSWVDSLMLQMTLEEKIAQMLMIHAYSNRDASHTRELVKQIRNYKVGGIMFLKGSPLRQANLTNILQEASEIPLLIAMDAEWGLAMRLDSTLSYPRQMMLGAISDNSLIYQMGIEITEQMKDLGVHIHIPVLESADDSAMSLSEKVVSGLLQKEMGFKGLLVTDALSMNGIVNYFKPGVLELEAVKAGNDILLMPSDVGKVINAIRRAVRRGIIHEEEIDYHCRKILMAKAWLGLEKQKPVITESLHQKLKAKKYLSLQHQLIENALTLVKNDNELIPLSDLSTLQLATLNIGVESETPFTKNLDLYLSGEHYFFNDLDNFPRWEELEKELIRYNTLIVNIHKTKVRTAGFGITEATRIFLKSLQFNGNIVLNIFGYPYALGELDSLELFDAILVSYSEDLLNQQYSAQGLFGGISFTGTIPVAAGSWFPAGTGIISRGGTRLKYSVPENVGMSSDTLKLIDKIVENAISEKAMPGCQVLVARRGEVIWNRSYGYHTYRNRKKVENGDLYDLASLTKISSTIPSLMLLQDQHKFSVDSTLLTYLPVIDTSDKGDLLIREVLTHQAGLTSWIPFYQSTLETLDTSETLFSNNFSYKYPLKLGGGSYANRNIVYKDSIYSKSYSEDYSLQVAEDLFLRNDYKDSIYSAILNSPLGEKTYKYSDLGYYLLYRAIEEISDTLFYPYTWFNFYGPLGAETLGFLPLKRFDSKRIVPTENDIIFRKQLLQGYVHDPGAAMLGGICGHAGLFSNANDLAKLMQMYLNYGVYGGEEYLDSATIVQYTSCQYCEDDNRRGLGFDRPVVDEANEGPACDSASALSYGHSGFTGTIAWMDPEEDLLYIFLSNRIHPDQANLKLISMDVRTEIQELLYRAIEN